jgi:hypothetical protein
LAKIAYEITAHDKTHESAAVKVIFEIVALFTRLSGCTLDIEQYRILMILKQCGPITPKDLAPRLGGLRISGRGLWNEERTTIALNKLAEIRLGKESIVIKADNDAWNTKGI